MLEWKSSQSGQFVQDNFKFGEVHNKPRVGTAPTLGHQPAEQVPWNFAVFMQELEQLEESTKVVVKIVPSPGFD